MTRNGLRQKPGQTENKPAADSGREHLELLRSGRYFKHRIRKEKFISGNKLDMMLAKLYLTL